MNAIDKAISDLKYKVPKSILEAAFIKATGFGMLGRRSPVSIDYRIREEVIMARVMEDCNLVGGQETSIPLASVRPEHLALNKTVWRIPLELTNNRLITKVISIVYSSGSSTPVHNVYNQGGSMYSDAASGLLDSHAVIPNVSNADIRLIGENTIMADAIYPSTPTMYLRCVLENEKEFNNLPDPAIPKFSKLVEYAVKSYIYNNLIIDIDKAALVGGQELGAFQNTVESYSDAEVMYEEYLRDVWRKVSILADPEAKRRHLSMLIGRR